MKLTFKLSAMFLACSFAWLVMIGSSCPVFAAAPSHPRVLAAYDGLPLRFEANRGQTDPAVRFLSRGPGYTLFLTSSEAVLTMAKSQAVVRLELAGADPRAEVTGEDELPARSHYLIGNQPAQWHTGVANFARVRYRSVYPGIDLVYYGDQKRLEHDFILAPGADPRRIALRVHGADQLRIRNGDVLIGTGNAEFRLLQPRIYQVVDGSRRHVAGRYVLRAGNTLGFELGRYDRRLPLVIDPVLSYSTYLGGATSDDYPQGIAVDASGNAYVVGYTYSSDFPTTAGAYQTAPKGGSDTAFLSKLSPDGSTLLYSTYIGGAKGSEAYGVTLDSAGNIYITGNTDSTDFPITANAIQKVNLSGDAFVLKLAPDGATVLYSTFLGGSSGDYGYKIVLDSGNNMYFAGSTFSKNFPTSATAYQKTMAGWYAPFAAKISSDGSTLIYATYLGGANGDFGHGLAVDSSGYAYVTGTAADNLYPVTPGAAQTTFGGMQDAFVTKLSQDGSALVYSTFLGGGNYETGAAIAVDGSGQAVVTGFTQSGNFPTTVGAFQTVIGTSAGSAFLTKLSADGSSMIYSTFLGGTGGPGGGDSGASIALNIVGEAWITGTTASADFPVTADAIQGSKPGAGNRNAFAAKLSAGGSSLLYSTYLGGSGVNGDNGISLALDTPGNVFVTGDTASTNFPVTAYAYQDANAGGRDAFLVKIGEPTPVLFVNVNAMGFTASEGGSDPAAQGFNVANNGGGVLTWNAVKTQPWLSLDVTIGTAPSAIHASVSVAGLAAGTYHDTITVASGGAIGSPVQIPVTLTVQPSVADFDLSRDRDVLSLAAGQPGTVILTVTPHNFSHQVAFTCSGMPASMQWSFSPAAVTPNGSPATATLTIRENVTAANHHGGILLWSGAGVAFGLCSLGGGSRSRRKWLAILLAVLALVLLMAALGGCGDTTPPVSHAGTATVTVNATSGSVQRTVTFTLVH